MANKQSLLSWMGLLMLCVVASFFVFYRYQDRYVFDWDQVSDTKMVEKISLEGKPMLVGPRVASDIGFFVGPFHYYFLAPFYFISGGNPWYGLWAVWFWKVLSIVGVFVIVRKLFGRWEAWGVGWMMAIETGITCWNVMYVGTFSLIAYLFLQKQLERTNKNWWCFVLFAMSGVLVHFSMASLLLPTFFAWVVFMARSKSSFVNTLKLLFGLVLLILPIVLFDIRHDFINIHNIVRMTREAGTAVINNDYWGNFVRAMGYFWGAKIVNGQNIYIFFATSLLIMTTGLWWYKKKEQRVFHLVWVMAPVVLLSRYGGNISEYYFSTTSALLILFSGFLIGKLKYLGLILAVFLLIVRLQVIREQRYFGGLQTKLNIANNLQKYRQDPTISVSYELPLGQDNGFEYLFNKYIPGFKPDGTGHLYTVTDRYQEKMGQKIFQEGIFVVYRK